MKTRELKKIRLKGVTQKGKNRVRENGELWEVIHMKSSISCLNGAIGMLIRPVRSDREGNLRWIAFENDQNFDWEKA